MRSALGPWRLPNVRVLTRTGFQIPRRLFTASGFHQEQESGTETTATPLNTDLVEHERDSKLVNKSKSGDPLTRKLSSKDTQARNLVHKHPVKGSKPEIRKVGGSQWHYRLRKPKIQILSTAEEVRAWRSQTRSENHSVGFVPTMGALHEGHLSLMRQAAFHCDEVVVSIFVNPAQFGPTEDLSTYPKTWAEDMRKLNGLNSSLRKSAARGLITAVFAPKVSTMYPGAQTNLLPTNLSYVTIDPALTGILEGAARPTFFRGVTTIVMKLFWIVQPDRAYFGQKDFQQLAVIRRMVRDFAIPVDIRMGHIVRGPGGLALSSRNSYLGERRREVATVLRRALQAGKEALRNGQYQRLKIIDAISTVMAEEVSRQKSFTPNKRALFEVEYISVADVHDLREIDDARESRSIVLSGTIVMLPLEEASEDEVLGAGGDMKPVRLLDNTVWTHRSKRPQKNADLVPVVEGVDVPGPVERDSLGVNLVASGSVDVSKPASLNPVEVSDAPDLVEGVSEHDEDSGRR